MGGLQAGHHAKKVLGRSGKLEQKIDIQPQTSTLDHHILQVTDYGYVEKVFMNLRRKWNRTGEWRDV